MQYKQSLLEQREETRVTSAAKVMRKTQRLTEETESATNDTRVHSSRSEDTAVGECEKRTKMTDQPPAKQKTKVLNAKERKLLITFLDSDLLSDTILSGVVMEDLKQQLLADNLKNLIKALCGDNKHFLTTLISCQRKCFSQLYIDCKKMPDPMLSFQICWHNQCSVILLSEEHNIAVLNLI